jgi:xylulokinase
MKFIAQIRIPENRSQGNDEIDPGNLWKVISMLLNRLPANLKHDLSSVCITGQGPTILPVSITGKPLYRCVTWLDQRGYDKIPEYLSLGYDAQIATGLAKLKWLERSIDETAFLIQPADYIGYKLTGKMMNMSFPYPGYLPWEQKALSEANLDARFKIPELVPTGTIAGMIKKTIAQKFDLPKKIVLISGAPDFVAALIGTGTVEDGFLCDRGGTSQGVTLCSSRKLSPPGLMTTPFFLPDLWKISAIMNTTGKALDWFGQKVIQKPLERLLSSAADMDRPTRLLFLPYLNGERSPYWDSSARGLFFGLDLESDAVKMSVAIMESTGYAIADAVRRMENAGCTVRTIRTTGGQAANFLWNQIKADILQKPVELPTVTESELLGNAILSISAFTNREIPVISRQTVHIKETFLPEENRAKEYQYLLNLYTRLYESNKELFSLLGGVGLSD